MASPLPNHLLNWMWYTKIAWNIHKLPKLPRNKTTQGAKWGTPGIPALGRKGGKMGEFSKTPSPTLPSPPRRQRQLKLPQASFYAASLSIISSWKCYQSHSLFINTWSLKWCTGCGGACLLSQHSKHRSKHISELKASLVNDVNTI